MKQKAYKSGVPPAIHVLQLASGAEFYIFASSKVDQSQIIAWRTDTAGEILTTVVSDANATQTVANDTHSNLFEREVAFWEAKIPPVGDPTLSNC